MLLTTLVDNTCDRVHCGTWRVMRKQLRCWASNQTVVPQRQFVGICCALCAPAELPGRRLPAFKLQELPIDAAKVKATLQGTQSSNKL